jgi:crossover junction endodeoxyribonuclease RuvC
MILGIDPGLSGALTFYDPEVNTLFAYDMPTFTVSVNKKQRRILDEDELVRIIAIYQLNHDLTAIVENVHSMPEQGVASSFKFGVCFGAIRGALAALQVPRRYVEPAVWKRHFKLTSDKDAARRRASELLPKHAGLWSLKKHDGRAEAALLAYFGAQLK